MQLRLSVFSVLPYTVSNEQLEQEIDSILGAAKAMEDKEKENADLRAQLQAMQQAFQTKDDELLSLQAAQQTQLQAKETHIQHLGHQISALDVQLQAKETDNQHLRHQMSALDVQLRAKESHNQHLGHQISALDVQLQAKETDNQHLRDEVSVLKAEVQTKAADMAREESLDLDAQLPENDSDTQNSRDENEGFKAQVRCELEDLQKEVSMIRKLVVLLVMFGVCMMMGWPSAAVGGVPYGSEGKAAKEYVQAENGMTLTPTTLAEFMVKANRIKQEEEERHQQTMREINEWSELSMKAYETESQIAKLCRAQGSALRLTSVCSMFGGTKADTVPDGLPELL